MAGANCQLFSTDVLQHAIDEISAVSMRLGLALVPMGQISESCNIHFHCACLSESATWRWELLFGQLYLNSIHIRVPHAICMWKRMSQSLPPVHTCRSEWRLKVFCWSCTQPPTRSCPITRPACRHTHPRIWCESSGSRRGHWEANTT